jgi:hypothetical protein
MQAVVRDILRTPTRETALGFMDKAKKLAEQAQEKLDEAQKNFDKSQEPEAPAGGDVRYDDHGRPIQQEQTPAAATEPPSAAPAEEAAAPPPPPKPSEGDANTTPDPFKPIE